MPDIYLSALCLLLTIALLGGTNTSILQEGKLRCKEVKQLPGPSNESEVDLCATQTQEG